MKEKDVNNENGILFNEKEYDDLTALFKMYADATRLKIFTALAEKERSVMELSDMLGMSHSAISHQLSSLRKHNLVKNRKVGLNVFYSLADDHVMTIFQQAFDHIREKSCKK